MKESAVEQQDDHESELSPSVYYADTVVRSTIERAWQKLLDYKAWNPSFANSEVTLLRGQPRTEGELVLIRKSILDSNGNPWPPFYAQTAKVVPQRRIVWYLYSRGGDLSRNFVDFGLSESSEGVRFSISYYAENPLFNDDLSELRRNMQSSIDDLTQAFKTFCESA